jgi:DHA2 family multidrug resistance protein
LVPQVIQGIGFGLIFVALSTAALATVEKSRMTSATGLYNLIRQLGGSFGTALVVTMLDRHINQARVDLVGNINSANTVFLQRLQGLTAMFMHQGYSAVTARDMALKAINGLIQQQAAMLAYDYIFLWIGLLFVLTLPLVFLLRTPKNSSASRGHTAMDD